MFNQIVVLQCASFSPTPMPSTSVCAIPPCHSPSQLIERRNYLTQEKLEVDDLSSTVCRDLCCSGVKGCCRLDTQFEI